MIGSIEPRWLSLSSLCEVVCAMHLSSYVAAPLDDRGGLMIVAPPGHLKTTALMILDRQYQNAVTYSNLNTQTLTRLRGDLGSGNVRSIVLPEMQSIYAGDPRTVERVEQTLMQMVSEGHIGASWEDSRHRKFTSRCTCFGAMPNTFFERHADEWNEIGFGRRFVWAWYRLADPDVLSNAIIQWQRAKINGRLALPQIPIAGEIPNDVSNDERAEIRMMLKHQFAPHEIQLLFLSRTLAALRWHYRRIGLGRDAMDTMREFGRALQDKAAELVIP